MLGVVTQTDFTRTLAKVFSTYPVIPELTAGHIMTPKVLTVSPKNTVAEGKQKMLKANVGAIIIMDKNVPVGIFTEYDVVMQFYDQHGKLEMNDIGKYMRKYVRAVSSDTSIFEANKLMLEKNMRRLLIVEGTEVKGILTQTDICRYTYGVFDKVIAAAMSPDANLKQLRSKVDMQGEFRSEHLKVYTIN